MATEVLAVPEEHLAEFCDMLEYAAQDHMEWNEDLIEGLREWIKHERNYLRRLAHG